MGSQWTDKSAILRDLSLAQGYWVPGGIDAVVAGEMPPTQVMAEETEADYFKHWTTDADFSTGPDLSLIKQMLDMVHDEEPEDEEGCLAPPAEIEITKPNPVVPYLRPTKKLHNTKEKQATPRRARNVAIASLLANEQITSPGVPLKLSKPDDFIKAKDTKNEEEIDEMKRKDESVKKVNSWLYSTNSAYLQSSMFRKRSPKGATEMGDWKDVGRNGSGGQEARGQYEQYRPSSWAGQYYRACERRAHVQQIVKDNIWHRAEKMMKEIDDRKAEEIGKQQEVDAALAAVLDAAEAEISKKEAPSNKLTGVEKVELPHHRHLMPGECIVCKVLTMKDAVAMDNELEPEAGPEICQAKPSEVESEEELNKTYLIGNESDEIFSLVRATFVENLTELEATEAGPEMCQARPSEVESEEGSNKTYLIGNESDEGIFSLVRATFVDNLTELEATDFTHLTRLAKPGSLEALDIFA